jgi:hypothetical protein
MEQLAKLESAAKRFEATPDGGVTVMSFQE